MAETTTVRRCIGSKRFGIEPHEAPVEDFPKQPSQKDGLGRMCMVQWNQYTAGLARDAKARRAASGEASAAAAQEVQPAPEEPTAEKPKGTRSRKRGAATVPAAGAQGDAG